MGFHRVMARRGRRRRRGGPRRLSDPGSTRRLIVARFAGVAPAALVSFCLGLSGALAGMAGLFEAAGPAGQITDGFGSGYGFTAIIVAFLGRLHPIGIVLAGLLMALTYIGGDIAQLMLQMPAATVQVFQGMLLFYLLGFDLLTRYRIRRRVTA